MSSAATSHSGAVLITGGTGKVGSRIAPLLHSAGIPTLVASRSGRAAAGLTGVKFDWQDRSTWEAALRGPDGETVTAVFLVILGVLDPTELAREFIDFALGKGTKRFVLLSGSPIEEGGPVLGGVHRLLREMGDEGKLSWAALRPTWFQENFADPTGDFRPVKEESRIYSATGPGRTPWVSCDDIAAVAFHALADPEPPNREMLILGPELITHGDIADIFTSVLGRKVMYHEITVDELAERRHRQAALPMEYAKVLASLDTTIRNGAEDRTNNLVFEVTGKQPKTFRRFVEENKKIWL